MAYLNLYAVTLPINDVGINLCLQSIHANLFTQVEDFVRLYTSASKSGTQGP
jgi:hypothetical protein